MLPLKGIGYLLLPIFSLILKSFLVISNQVVYIFIESLFLSFHIFFIVLLQCHHLLSEQLALFNFIFLFKCYATYCSIYTVKSTHFCTFASVHEHGGF